MWLKKSISFIYSIYTLWTPKYSLDPHLSKTIREEFLSYFSFYIRLKTKKQCFFFFIVQHSINILTKEYFELLKNKNAIEFCKFRTTHYKLPIDRNNRICFLCNDDIRDEFHYVLRCLSRKLLLLLLIIITIMWMY